MGVSTPCRQTGGGVHNIGRNYQAADRIRLPETVLAGDLEAHSPVADFHPLPQGALLQLDGAALQFGLAFDVLESSKSNLDSRDSRDNHDNQKDRKEGKNECETERPSVNGPLLFFLAFLRRPRYRSRGDYGSQRQTANLSCLFDRAWVALRWLCCF
jgi:hypothetical protein